MKPYLYIFLLITFAQRVSAQATDTFQVYFSLNDTKLDTQDKSYLDSIVHAGLIAPGHKLRLFGYADYLGKAAHNDSLSQLRAKDVQDYLFASGFKSEDFTYCVGEGEIIHKVNKNPGGNYRDRKVLIITDRLKERGKIVSKSLIDINTIQVEEPVPLKNIFFQEGTSEILPESYPELEQLYNFMYENKNVTIRIEGHICCLDPKDGTDVQLGASTLSAARAHAVYNYLLAKKIDKKRLSYIGLGNTKPRVFPEVSDEDMERNRRVEIRIVSK